MYALGADRVLRIAREGVTYRTEKYDLFQEIERRGLPWPLPELLDHGVIEGHHYAVETRLHGRSLDNVLQDAYGEAREQALTNYAAGALRIRESRVRRAWFGELYYDPGVRDRSWPAYLTRRARLHVEKAGAPFAAEVPALDEIVSRFGEEITAVDAVQPGLVHGDYFPGNVLVGDDHEITAVIDFGWSTLVGDPRLDAVCASVFLEVDRPWCTPGDAAFVREAIFERDPSVRDVFDLYRTYCALHFSFAIHYGIPLSRWCVRTLNAL